MSPFRPRFPEFFGVFGASHLDYVRVYQRDLLGALADRETTANTTLNVPLTINNPTGGAYTLTVRSSNTAVLPDQKITVTNTNGKPTGLRLTPTTSGVTTVNVQAWSGSVLKGDITFVLRVNAVALNGMFEPGMSGWTPFGRAYWVNYNQRTEMGAVRMDNAGSGIRRTVTGLRPNTTYELTAWAFGQRVGSSVATVQLEASGFNGAAVSRTDITNSRYVAGKLQFQTGPHSTSATISARLLSGQEAYIDDLSLVEVRVAVPAAPTGLSASDGAFSDRVRVVWQAVSGATSYDVYRGTSSDPGQATQIASGLSTTTYDDMTASAGVVYSYWVKARNAAGASPFSASDTGSRAAAAQAVRMKVDSMFTTEGTSAGDTKLVVTVDLETAPTQPVSVRWRTQDGSARAGVDYVYGSDVLQWAAGQTRQTFYLLIKADSVVEGTETFTVGFEMPNGVVSASPITIAILDDDGATRPVEYKKRQQYGPGTFESDIFFVNSTGYVIAESYVQFQAPWTSIRSMWNGSVVRKDGDVFTLRVLTESWQQPLQPGQSGQMGFVVDHALSDVTGLQWYGKIRSF